MKKVDPTKLTSFFWRTTAMIKLSLFFVAHQYIYFRNDPEYTVVSGPHLSEEVATAAAAGLEPLGESDDYTSHKVVVLEAALDERHISARER